MATIMQQDAQSEKQSENKGVFQNLNLAGRFKTVSTDFSYGWKTLASKAKKEVNTLNKKARKALATYEEGSSVNYDQIYDCDFEAGFPLWKRFQESWVAIRNDTVKNISLAEDVDVTIQSVNKSWRKWESAAAQLHDNLVAVPDIIAQVKIAQMQVDAISERISKVEELLLQYEDACERVELGRKKYEEELELSTLVEKRQKAFQDLKAKYEMTEEESGEAARVIERQESVEKQQVYEDAFLEQMEKYLQYGEFDKPIAGSAGQDHETEEVSFDESDLAALREFLGPEEMDTVLRSQAVISASQSNKASNSNTADTKEDTNESKTEEKSTSPTSQDTQEENGDTQSTVESTADDGNLDSKQEEPGDKEAEEDEQWFDSQTVDE